ncbi:DUF3268 family zinc-finger domain-containing protein [Morganella psychrotolerans]|uniref:Uncharacterized protein n=1 Tax=Morganella psychrotolerans TaxID=368603 RepID=A0A5M9R0H3_9GAMM|nr:zinc-finger-containing protein [Morganella psychrotolerans]KAA8712975.1 hypothetical protein F4V73_17815 [Morganella psychrotolerans]OBU01924.1 hypothetical protein AYY16_17095 [Morganella psychrotolerans]
MKVKTPFNPSKRAECRVKDPVPAPTSCHYCSGNVAVASNDCIYGREYGVWPWVYLCGSCGAYVGLHPFTAIPLGSLADYETREARKHSKRYFSNLLTVRNLKRSDGYKIMADEMGIDRSKCHFGMFDIEMCNRAADACERLLKVQQ